MYVPQDTPKRCYVHQERLVLLFQALNFPRCRTCPVVVVICYFQSFQEGVQVWIIKRSNFLTDKMPDLVQGISGQTIECISYLSCQVCLNDWLGTQLVLQV